MMNLLACFPITSETSERNQLVCRYGDVEFGEIRTTTQALQIITGAVEHRLEPLCWQLTPHTYRALCRSKGKAQTTTP